MRLWGSKWSNHLHEAKVLKHMKVREVLGINFNFKFEYERFYNKQVKIIKQEENIIENTVSILSSSESRTSRSETPTINSFQENESETLALSESLPSNKSEEKTIEDAKILIFFFHYIQQILTFQYNK